MTQDELRIYELISDKGDLLGAIDVLLRNDEDKSEELVVLLRKEKQSLMVFISDLFDLKRSITLTESFKQAAL